MHYRKDLANELPSVRSFFFDDCLRPMLFAGRGFFEFVARCASCLLAFHAVLADVAPWPMKGRDLQRTGSSPYGSARNGWGFGTTQPIQSSPAIGADGTVFFGELMPSIGIVAFPAVIPSIAMRPGGFDGRI